jgi:DNA-binding transcriptional regulator YiaG
MLKTKIKTFKASAARPPAKTYRGVTPAAVLEMREDVGATVAQLATYYSMSESTITRYCRQARAQLKGNSQ